MKGKSKFSVVLLILACVMLIVTLNTVPVSANRVFSDLNVNHWCYPKIISFEEKGYINGYEDGTFRADKTITRAEYTKIVNNFFGYELETQKDSGLKDVKSGDWFYPYINEAVERGYITGYEDGSFRPNEPIRRQEATVILSRILGIDKEKYPEDHIDGLAQYSDSNQVQEWARNAINSYSVYNFINGYEDGTIKILKNVTRAETIELLHILEQKVVIPDKGGSSGGGGIKIDRVQSPVIKVYELKGNDLVEAASWINNNTKYKNGALVKIECSTSGANIYYSVNGNKEEKYTEPFVLEEGIHEIKAHSEKSYMADSTTVSKKVLVDTVAPKVIGKKNATTVSINVEDYDYFKVGKEKISGLNDSSLKYAWFTYDDQKGDYVRETKWTELKDNVEIAFPENPGEYFIGILGQDNAKNKIGTGFFEKVSNIDDNIAPSNVDETVTFEPFTIVTEVKKESINKPSGEFSGDVEEKEEIIEVTVDSKLTIIHDFEDMPESGDVYKELELVPGTKYTVEPLTSGDYADVVNYKNDGKKK